MQTPESSLRTFLSCTSLGAAVECFERLVPGTEAGCEPLRSVLSAQAPGWALKTYKALTSVLSRRKEERKGTRNTSKRLKQDSTGRSEPDSSSRDAWAAKPLATANKTAREELLTWIAYQTDTGVCPDPMCAGLQDAGSMLACA